ncbi:hypothetical protein EPK97_19545 [Chengkuizengella sediminis]|nr:hypothetical protein [Chengkuizengella sediminis]
MSNLAEKAVKASEIADGIIQPETIELLTILPEVSKSLQTTLLELKKIEESGTLQTLVQLAEFIGSTKQSITGTMISDMVEKAIKGIEIADTLVQKGSIDIAEGAVSAFDKAKLNRLGKEPLTTMKLTLSLFDRDVREGLSLILDFLKFLPKELGEK